MGNNRTTFLIGAGTPLDLVLPQDVIKPATAEITNDVRRAYTDYLTSSKVTYTVNQLVMRILVQIWAFYNDAF